jgi:putative aminopeptidase FrvX
VPLPDLLHELLTTPGPSGHEGDAAVAWRRSAEGFAEVSADVLGSSVARVKGTADGPTLALVGHIDEIGLAVTHIDDKGFLFFRGLGGWLPEVLLAQRVEVLTRDGHVPGVIGKKGGPFKKDKDEKIELKNLFIDIGARDGADARSLVRIGDGAVLAPQPVELRNNRVASRSSVISTRSAWPSRTSTTRASSSFAASAAGSPKFCSRSGSRCWRARAVFPE